MSVNSVDPYKASQDVTEKMLLEELETQSHNSDICDSETERSDTSENYYVPSEHSDQEECDHVFTPEVDSDGDNVTASDDSDADSETEGGYEAKNGQIWNKLTPLVSHCREHNILYLHESSEHPFRGFLGPKNQVRIRIDGALDAHAESETMISLSVGS